MTKLYSTQLCFLVIAAILLLPVQSAFAFDKGILGYWKATDADGKPQSVFKLWEYQGKLIGRIVKLFPKPDENRNPICTGCTGAQHNKPHLGLIFLWGFVPDPDNDKKWTDGT
jgi:hypothetical protein